MPTESESDRKQRVAEAVERGRAAAEKRAEELPGIKERSAESAKAHEQSQQESLAAIKERSAQAAQSREERLEGIKERFGRKGAIPHGETFGWAPKPKPEAKNGGAIEHAETFGWAPKQETEEQPPEPPAPRPRRRRRRPPVRGIGVGGLAQQAAEAGFRSSEDATTRGGGGAGGQEVVAVLKENQKKLDEMVNLLTEIKEKVGGWGP